MPGEEASARPPRAARRTRQLRPAGSGAASSFLERWCEQPEPVTEPITDFDRAHRDRSGRGQLDTEREPVQAPADLEDGAAVYRLGEVDAGLKRPGSFDEKSPPGRARASSSASGSTSAVAHRVRRGLPRRREHTQGRGLGEQPGPSPRSTAATCPQLSSTMSVRRPESASTRVWITGVPVCGAIPRDVATASGTASGSISCASSTIHTPSGYSSTSAAPTSIDRRVLPTPPRR